MDDPTGFKFRYRSVEPNDYGLDAGEILAATNQELNAFVSLKRMAPYADREWHASAQHRKRFRERLVARRKEAATTLSKAEIKKRKIGKNRFDKAAAASAVTVAKPAGMSSSRLKSFGQ